MNANSPQKTEAISSLYVLKAWGAVCVAITSLVFAQGIASLQQRLGVNYLP